MKIYIIEYYWSDGYYNFSMIDLVAFNTLKDAKTSVYKDHDYVKQGDHKKHYYGVAENAVAYYEVSEDGEHTVTVFELEVK